MDLQQKFICIVILILSNYMTIYLHGTPTEGTVINKELTGRDLIKMGKVMKNSLLLLLGGTFEKLERNLNETLIKIGDTEKKLQDDIEDAAKDRDALRIELCKLIQCEAWTGWSRCSAYTHGSFGVKVRSRKCAGNSSMCLRKSAETVETDYQICRGNTCQHTLTNNKYCIKLHKVPKTQIEARDVCHKDGGYLIKIDNALKAEDIKEYYTNISYTFDVWIDGIRTLPNGDWKYEYGSIDSTFSMWRNEEPRSQDDCKVYSGLDEQWDGRSCTSQYHFLCEIV